MSQHRTIRSNDAQGKIMQLIPELDVVTRRNVIHAIARAASDWDELIRLDIPIKTEMTSRSRASSAPQRRR